MKKSSFASLLVIFFLGCAPPNTTKIYINPSLNSTKITSVAVFPLRNAAATQRDISLTTGDMIEINKMFQTAFAEKNSKINMINSFSSVELLNQGSLVDLYGNLLSVYEQTGVLNTETLKKIGQYLKTDAIIQGFVMQVYQRDGAFIGLNGTPGETKVTIKYTMFSTVSGDVLWEASCDGYKGVNAFKKAPPVSDAVEKLREKIISAIPIL